MLLKEFVEKKRCLFVESVPDWREAVRQSCRPLVDDGTVSQYYAQEIITCVEAYGPYIVFMPGFALPHCQECSRNARGTGISFMKTEQPVAFSKDDPEKCASVFFTIAAIDSGAHLKNMRRLFKLLTNDELCRELLQVRSEQDLLRLDDQYCIAEAADADAHEQD